MTDKPFDCSPDEVSPLFNQAGFTKNPTPPNPIHQVDRKVFLVWAETWADIVGAYATHDQAQQALDAYCQTLDARTPEEFAIAFERLDAVPQVEIPREYQFDYVEDCGGH